MWLKELKGKQFDLVFMDAAKGQYLDAAEPAQEEADTDAESGHTDSEEKA